ncbi:Peptide chain release factor 1-like, mitochondrial [Anthophora retusa]
MLVLIKGCTFCACRYYGNIVSRTKLFELWRPLFLNLHVKLPSISKLFSSEKNLFATEAYVQKYLNDLMNAYRNEENQENFSQILKLARISLLLDEKIKINENLKNLSDLVNENKEMETLAKEEESLYKEQLLEIDDKIINTILQHLNTGHYDNVFMEIVPGIGGQEAMIFTLDLFNMYKKYFDYLGFQYEVVELLESDGTNGLRKASFLIFDSKAFEKLQHECGVHRVQRTPATEKMGRVHTSTAVVTVTPEPKNVDIQLDEKDLKIDAKRATGAGGQHVNTTNSAIRITHIPTGKSVTCQSNKSQIKNKELALIKLKSLLYEEQLNNQDSLISEMRKKQMGRRLRNEKIRTYNFKQDRVTDHRIPNGTVHHLNNFFEGVGLEELTGRLNRDMKQKILLEIIEKTDSQLK